MNAWACIVSGEGRGAIALIRLWGPDALLVADRAFRTHRPPPLSKSPIGRPRLGRIGSGPGDEAVAIVHPAEVEFQGHGGPLAQAMAMDALIAAGAISASPSDWARHEQGDPISAHALLDLALAPTLKTAEILFDQSSGALTGELRSLVDDIANPSADPIHRIDELLFRSGVGLRLLRGWTIATAGRPNVGKSRLLNALAGFDRAIVSAEPGTTRDVVTFRSAISGWPVDWVDSAGLREPTDAIEAAGIALAADAHCRADLVLVILDRSEPLSAADLDLIAAFPGGIRVANKSDLPASWPASSRSAIEISATTGDGIPALLAAVARRLVPDIPPAGVGVPFRPRHVASLRAARRRLLRGRPDLAAGIVRRLLGGSVGDRDGLPPSPRVA